MSHIQHPFAAKFRFIFAPFLIVAGCIVIGYTLLNWLVFIKLHVFPVKEDILHFWVPFLLPWIPLYIWVNPRLKLLNLRSKKTDTPWIYIFIAAFTIAIPTIIAQSWLQTATGTLTRLDNIRQIDNKPATKYYTLQHFYIDKFHLGLHSSFDVSGRSNEELNMNIYAVFPILAQSSDTSNPQHIAWYGVQYHKQISNRLSQQEKEARYNQFFDESQLDLINKNLNRFLYFDRIGYTDDRQGYLEAIKSNAVFAGNTSTIVLVPVNEPFEQRNGHKLGWIFVAFAIGSIIWLIMLAIPKINETVLQSLNSSSAASTSSSSSLSSALSFFIPRKDFFITPIIVDLNILIFILMVFAGLGVISFHAPDLLSWGANYRPYTADGQWWRLVTSIFLHGGLMHLFANMYGLIFVGIFLEPKIGKAKYATLYFVTGIIASLTSLWWHTATISVGASGAIFGLYGAFLALLLNRSFPQAFTKTFLYGTLIFVAYNLLAGLAGSGTDNAAHLGGLVSGFVLGWLLSPDPAPNTSGTDG